MKSTLDDIISGHLSLLLFWQIIGGRIEEFFVQKNHSSIGNNHFSLVNYLERTQFSEFGTSINWHNSKY